MLCSTRFDSVNSIQLTGIYVDYVLNCDLLQPLRLISFCAIWMLIFLSAKINWISFIVFQINKFHMNKMKIGSFIFLANKNLTVYCFYLWFCVYGILRARMHSSSSSCLLFFQFRLVKIYVCFTDIMIHITHDKQVSGICSVSLHSLRISGDFISCVRFKLKWFLSLSVHEQHTNTTNDIRNKNQGKKINKSNYSRLALSLMKKNKTHLDNVWGMEKETQLEAQMNSFTSELTANEARKDPYVLT